MRYDAPEVNDDGGALLNGIELVLNEQDMTHLTLDILDNQFVYKEN